MRQQDNPNRAKNYRRFENTINMDGISYPLKLRNIDKFENQNISINVFAYEEKKIFPVRITNAKGRQHVNLLVITNNGNRRHHFILIKSPNRLLCNTRNIMADYIFVLTAYMMYLPMCTGQSSGNMLIAWSAESLTISKKRKKL